MEMKRIVLKGLIIMWGIVCWGCKEDMPTEDTSVPRPLENVVVSNIPGGVVVSYQQPSDQSVALITAEYSTDEGGKEIKRFDAKEYNTGFTLAGMTATKRSMELYTVSHSGIRSESLSIDIEPLLSLSLVYLQDILASIDFVSIPGGVAMNFENPELEELTFVLEFKEGDIWSEYSRFNTDQMEELFVLNDFLYTDYRVYVEYQDEESLERSVAKNGNAQALEEFELEKNTWRIHQLPNDNWEANFAGLVLSNLWDNNLDMITAPRFENKKLPLPHSFTIDLGASQDLSLSKIRIYPHSNFLANSYTQYNPKTIEVWGSNSPDVDGGWNNWQQLATCVSQMPSGGPKNTDDLAYLRSGEIYHFPLFTSAYRYIRFRVLDTWTLGAGESINIRLSEVTLYGVEAD